MLSAVRKRLTYANVAMTLALVFAMTGGAFAAKHYLITSTKQISPKVLKALAGKAGPAGPAGAVGLAGSQGPAGAAGKDGAAGPQGPAGSQGPEGKEGKAGQTGFTKTLPKGATETGDWEVSVNTTGGFERASNAVSFNIPLAEPLTAAHVHIIRPNGEEAFMEGTTEKERKSTVCTGSRTEPSAEPGNLCVYVAVEEDSLKSAGVFLLPAVCPLGEFPLGGYGCAAAQGNGKGTDVSGFGVQGFSSEAGFLNASGTWAVAAE